jgi:hypothetical protein
VQGKLLAGMDCIGQTTGRHGLQGKRHAGMDCRADYWQAWIAGQTSGKHCSYMSSGHTFDLNLPDRTKVQRQTTGDAFQTSDKHIAYCTKMHVKLFLKLHFVVTPLFL